MTIDQLTQWMQHPDTLNQSNVHGLRELTEEFPYFGASRMLLLKTLQKSNDLLFDTEIRKTATYCPDRRKLYFLLYPANVPEKAAPANPVFADPRGDYFSITEIEEDPAEAGQSLKSMAQKLKAARRQKQQERGAEAPTPVQPPKITPAKATVAQPVATTGELIYTEDEAIRLIRAKDFQNALKILRVLNLNIPEKSIYFADQIRYLEKIIATINKS